MVETLHSQVKKSSTYSSMVVVSATTRSIAGRTTSRDLRQKILGIGTTSLRNVSLIWLAIEEEEEKEMRQRAVEIVATRRAGGMLSRK